jgi:hypothetical protein
VRKPKPVPNAKAVVRHSWSFQLNAVVTVASTPAPPCIETIPKPHSLA